MAASPISRPDRQDPPDLLLVRTAEVGTNALNTIRVPGDPFGDESSRWFDSSKGPLLHKGNEVKYLIDGDQAFPEMVAAVRTATNSDHFIYILNWWMDLDFELSADHIAGEFPVPPFPDDKLNLGNLLERASQNGVMVRAMLWDHAFSLQNTNEVRRINLLQNGAAILDDTGNAQDLPFLRPIPIVGQLARIPVWHFGSQHQKILCVFGNQGLICFCGGIDFNPDRIWSPGRGNGVNISTLGAPLHDVHCRVRGPATRDLLKVFTQRWDDHPDGIMFNRYKAPLRLVMNAPVSAGNHFVRIGRTFRPGLYNFDNDVKVHGEKTAQEIILKGIQGARRFIYAEDQYFVGNSLLELELVNALKAGQVKHLTVVLTHWRISDLPLVQRHRHKFINALRKEGGDRVRIFARNPTGITKPPAAYINYRKPLSQFDRQFDDFDQGKIAHTYVHAKLWIMDDELAIIGSVNLNRRSWTHDSEVTAGIYDTSRDTVLTYRLAHRLRIQLWQEHLGMTGANGEAELADGVASAVHWLPGHRPSGAQVQEYDENENTGLRDDIPIPLIGPLPFVSSELVYSHIIDPA